MKENLSGRSEAANRSRRPSRRGCDADKDSVAGGSFFTWILRKAEAKSDIRQDAGGGNANPYAPCRWEPQSVRPTFTVELYLPLRMSPNMSADISRVHLSEFRQ